MNLNTSQIDALVNKLYNEINPVESIDREAIKAKYLKKIPGLIKQAKALFKEAERTNKLFNESLYESIGQVFGSTSYQTKQSYHYFIQTTVDKEVNKIRASNNIIPITKQTIRDEVVLTTIDCKDLDEVISKIKSKFMKKAISVKSVSKKKRN